ncbi:unnamed protein product, partial [Ectocarpus fasciculatus]
CGGERVIQESGWLDLTIPKGAPNQHRIHFPGVGSNLPGRTAGDVEVAINIEPHERFMRDGSNLRMEIPISLTEALSGFTREIQLLNGSTVLLNRTRMISHNGEIEIEGGGLPVWDGGRGAGAGWSAHPSTNASALLGDKTVTGSTIVTCSVEFPVRASTALGLLETSDIERGFFLRAFQGCSLSWWGRVPLIMPQQQSFEETHGRNDNWLLQ